MINTLKNHLENLSLSYCFCIIVTYYYKQTVTIFMFFFEMENEEKPEMGQQFKRLSFYGLDRLNNAELFLQLFSMITPSFPFPYFKTCLLLVKTLSLIKR
ncbi:hypothetical protein CW304_07840 [Bacillus sp. UFRGS-B20]|nr:hypothetical protein CW304_07840 [Bacillus sp. UFRGS-B20]